MQCCLPFARAALALAADALPQAEREGFASPPRVVADVEDSLRSAGPEAFVQGLSAQWDRVVAALARPGAGASGAAGQGAAQVLSAATTTLPLLVSALTATAEAVEAHEKKAAENRAARKRSPLVPPLEPFNPVRFVAAFLVRHHPSLGAPIAGAQVNAYAGTLARILEAARAGVSA
jgi:cell division septation protein DedD